MAKRAAVKQESLAPTGSVDAEADSNSGARRSVTIQLAGKEYRLRSEASEESLQQVARYVDGSMQQIRERTDTVDSLDIALLTALNLARDVLHLREQLEEMSSGSRALDDASDLRLRNMIELIEAELPAADPLHA